MENIVREYLDKFAEKHARQRRYACLLGVLALLVCLAVFWRLKLTGTAMTNEAACGLQEHTHTEDCYTEELVCDIATDETADGTAHVHTADCYERVLTCELPEHTHTADCYSDAEADTETEADWEKTIPQEELTGDWAQDTVLVAESQVGYTESNKNWQLDDDGTRRGYTRYGAWYGNTYGDWNGMFAAFCLRYAGVRDDYLTTKNAAGVNAWAVALYQAGQLQGTGHEAVPGDVVFMGSDVKIESCGIVADVYEDNGTAMLTVLAGDVDDAVAELTVPADSDTILGYAATADAYAAYEADHPAEPVDEAPADEGENTEEPADTDNADDVIADDVDKTDNTEETTEEPTQDDTQPDENRPESDAPAQDAEQNPTQPPFDTLEGDTDTEAATVQGTPIDMAGFYNVTTGDGTTENRYYITDAYAESTVYDKANDFFTTKLHIDFAIPTQQARDANGQMTYTLPDGIRVPEEVLGKIYTGRNGDDEAFDFSIKKNDDNIYVIDFKFRDDFLSTFSENTIDGDMYFNATIGADKINDDGDVTVNVHEQLDLTIRSDEIKYDKDETAHSNIKVEKTGSYLSDSGELYYEVTISSTKGTPDKITVEDKLTLDGVTITAFEVDSITLNANGTVDASVTDYTKTVAEDNKSFTLNLPALPAANDKNSPSSYKIVYKYTLADPPKNGSYTKNAYNELTAKSTKEKETVEDSTNSNVTVRNELITKKGSYDKNKNEITWTITLNKYGQNNLAGKTLTDTMFANGEEDVGGKIPYDSNFTVKAENVNGNGGQDTAASYTVETVEKDGKQYVKDIKFNDAGDGKNYYRYTITYKTPADRQLNKVEQSNTAYIGDDAGSTGSTDTVTIPGADTVLTKTGEKGKLNADGMAEVTWTVTIKAPAGGIPAGTQAKDTLSKSGNGNNYLTKGQAQQLRNTLVGMEWVDADSIKFSMQDKADAYAAVDTLPDNAQIRYVTFTTSRQLQENEEVTFSYLSTVKFDDFSSAAAGTTVTAKNSFALVNGPKADASVTYYKYDVTKTTVGQTWNNNVNRDDEFSWSVKITYEKEAENQPDSIKVVDTLPKGVQLTKVWVGATEDPRNMNQDQLWEYGKTGFDKKSEGNAIAKTISVKSLDVQSNPDGTTTVTILLDPTAYIAANPNKPWYHVCYTCKITDDTWNNNTKPGEKTSVKFTNSVEVTTGDNQPYGNPTTSTGTLNFDRTSEAAKPVGKTGVVNAEAHTIDYRLELNPDGKTYNNGEQLTLTDQLNLAVNGGFSAHLKDGSVQLYHARRNADGSLTEGEPLGALEWGWKYRTKTSQDAYYYIDVQIPDSTPLVLKYSYNIEYTGTSSNPDIWAQNTAKLQSDNNKSGSNTISQKWVVEDGGGAVQNKLTLVKVDSRSSGITLQGAIFNVYKVEKDGKVSRTDKTYTTGADGVIRISKSDGYAYNTIYYLQEEEAPFPYKADKTQHYSFYFSRPGQPDNKPENYAQTYNPVDLSNMGRTEYVANAKESVDVEVVKHWKTGDGTTELDTASRQPVTIKLYRFVVTDDLWSKYQTNATLTAEEQQTLDTARDAAEETDSITLTEDNQWRYAFRYLSVKAEENQKYIYFVKEDALPGFSTDVSQTLPTKNADDVWIVKADVTNRLVSSYKLPETGGRGTLPYLAGGAALMSVSLLGRYRKKRRKTQRQGN